MMRKSWTKWLMAAVVMMAAMRRVVRRVEPFHI